MNSCIICQAAIEIPEDEIAVDVESLRFHAHRTCIVGLVALIEKAGNGEISSGRAMPSVLSKLGEEWVVVDREAPIGIIMLSYLSKSERPIATEALYEWLKKNEIKRSNLRWYVQDLKQRGMIIVINTAEGRLIQASPKGLETLRDHSERVA